MRNLYTNKSDVYYDENIFSIEKNSLEFYLHANFM